MDAACATSGAARQRERQSPRLYFQANRRQLFDRAHGYQYPSWGNGNNAAREIRAGERDLECEVSTVIGAMPFLWLAIDDEAEPASLRGLIERNSIALLSNYRKDALDAPSPDWLGRRCDRERVRGSGLWNSNHVDEAYDPAFLTTLEQLVDRTGSAP